MLHQRPALSHLIITITAFILIKNFMWFRWNSTPRRTKDIKTSFISISHETATLREKEKKIDRGSIRTSPRYCLSTPYRLTIRNNTIFFSTWSAFGPSCSGPWDFSESPRPLGFLGPGLDNKTRSQQGQAWNSDFELWSGFDSGLPTWPITISLRLIQSVFHNVSFEHREPPCILPFAVHLVQPTPTRENLYGAPRFQ